MVLSIRLSNYLQLADGKMACGRMANIIVHQKASD